MTEIETIETTLSELLEKKQLFKGSWISIPYDTRSFSINSEKSGYKTDQVRLNSTNHIYRFAGKKTEDGKLLFLGNPSNYEVNLFGIKAYLNGDAIFNELCSEMYGIPKYGISARSLSEKDCTEISSYMEIVYSTPEFEKRTKNIFLGASPKPLLKSSEICTNNFMVGIKYLHDSELDSSVQYGRTYYLKKEHPFSFSVCPILEIPEGTENIIVLTDSMHRGTLPNMAFQMFFGETDK